MAATMLDHVRFTRAVLLMLAYRLWLLLLKYCHPTAYRKEIVSEWQKTQTEGTGLTPDDLEADYISINAIRMIIPSIYYRVYSIVAALGEKAPNPATITMDGVQCHLLDFATKAGRPLVVNFGSCT